MAYARYLAVDSQLITRQVKRERILSTQYFENKFIGLFMFPSTCPKAQDITPIQSPPKIDNFMPWDEKKRHAGNDTSAHRRRGGVRDSLRSLESSRRLPAEGERDREGVLSRRRGGGDADAEE